MDPIILRTMLSVGLALLTAISLVAAIVAARVLRRKDIAAKIAGADSTAGLAGKKELGGAVAKTVAAVGERLGASRASGNLRRDLIRAGLHGANMVRVYMGTKVLLLISGTMILLFLLSSLEMSAINYALLTAMGAGVCYFMPNIYVTRRARHRADQVHTHLPDAMDLLEICVSSGMGLDAAWNAVAGEMRLVCPVLADEMALTNEETHLGVSRSEAMRHMADRTRDDDISSFVSIVIQAERFGTSISTALQTFAAGMREIRSQHAEELAERVAVKLILPMVLFIFPAMLIVVVGPAGITLARVLRG